MAYNICHNSIVSNYSINSITYICYDNDNELEQSFEDYEMETFEPAGF